MANGRETSRRKFVKAVGRISGALGAYALIPPIAWGQGASVLTKPIPSTRERLPVIGMGSWLTFDVGGSMAARAIRRDVLQAFFDHGGALIDSSPMYGSSEEVIGDCLRRITRSGRLFAATKVWTLRKQAGIEQMERSRHLWGSERVDLMQIHNMLSWEAHLDTLKAMKAQGRIRYIGITTSHGRRHERLERVMAREPFDFVQFTYNIVDREAERRLLPLAAERGIAVIVNRPFDGGNLFRLVEGKPLPRWPAEFDCANWAQFFLKFVVSHPAVTCAIPATSQVAHMVENMGATVGRLPDARERQRMAAYYRQIS